MKPRAQRLDATCQPGPEAVHFAPIHLIGLRSTPHNRCSGIPRNMRINPKRGEFRFVPCTQLDFGLADVISGGEDERRFFDIDAHHGFYQFRIVVLSENSIRPGFAS